MPGQDLPGQSGETRLSRGACILALARQAKEGGGLVCEHGPARPGKGRSGVCISAAVAGQVREGGCVCASTGRTAGLARLARAGYRLYIV